MLVRHFQYDSSNITSSSADVHGGIGRVSSVRFGACGGVPSPVIATSMTTVQPTALSTSLHLHQGVQS